MLNPWDPQTAPLRNDSSVYDFSFGNPTGLNANNVWNTNQLAMLNFDPNNRNHYIRPDATQQSDPSQITTYLQNEQAARLARGLAPGSGQSGAGLPLEFGSSGAPASGSSATSGGLAGTSSGFSPSSLGLSGASGASGSAGAGLGMGGATSGATGASGGFWGAAKGVLGNKAIMSGIVTGLSSAYGQYQQKNAAKDAYKWQSKELEAQRAYQQELYERKQNSPAAKMSRALLQYYMPIYIEKLKKHNKGADTSALDQLLASMSGGV